ncbi:PEP-CTERM sorting domain-containing protein [Noviherbaspirillum autotrophicum]|uniref:Ice-binding protein C-terminal domain-containing protein n=1 Tax=Noviherbaspirillum autotrophicum TaxID=709839 RepID=A0A0C2BWU7_9BURK|nr:PEP-CTERM sorting domain-containing protein [Noviherbaspirillum autotrophicum]KIF82486.1 hypothetical protein TSA66_19375 [Noviherbaspirillum autotrophicum]
MKKFMLVLSLLLGLQTAHAALVAEDYSSVGDGLITLDTESGLEWLDFTATRGLTVSQVLSGMGGYSATFRYATRSEIQELLAHAGFSTLNTYAPEYVTLGQAFNNLFNSNGSACGGSLPWACALSISPDTQHLDLINVGVSLTEGGAFLFPNYAPTDYQHEWYGSALVRVDNNGAVVPEPSAILLLGIGLLALAAKRQQRQG